MKEKSMSENTNTETGKSSGCGTWALRGCGAVVILIAGLVVLGVIFSKEIIEKGKAFVQRGSGATMEFVAKKTLEGIQYPEPMRTAVMEPILEFTNDVKAGRIPAEKAGKVAEELVKARVMGPVLVPVFQSIYIDPSSLSSIEKELMARNLSRYAEGLRLQKIPEQTAGDIWNLISEPKPGTGNDPDTRELKKTLTPEELKMVMGKMQTSADQAGIAEQLFTFQPQDEIRRAIQRGLGNTAEQQ
jgi:hypothetical protein